jgi:preprotein translocase subunit SecA
MGMDDETPLESGMVSKSIEQAQTKVEGHNFDIRKHVVQYDDVMNQHRDYIYTDRRKILEGADIRSNLTEMLEQEIERAFDAFAPGEEPGNWDIAPLMAEIKAIFALPSRFNEKYIDEHADTVYDEVVEEMHKAYAAKEKELGEEKMRTLERLVLLGTIDRLWVYHLTALEEMRQGIGLTGYGGRDPLVEFKREAYDMFDQLKEHIRQQVARRIFHVTLTPQAAPPPPPTNVQESGPGDTPGANGNGGTTSKRSARKTAAATATAGGTATATSNQPGPSAPGRTAGKVGRNDPCPCGSGKKYKKCHGAGAGI